MTKYRLGALDQPLLAPRTEAVVRAKLVRLGGV